MSMVFQCTKLHLTACNSSWVLSIKQNVNFNFEPPASSYFLDSRKSALTKSCSLSEDLSAYNILRYHAELCKFCTHLSSLKIPQTP
jgi:hypothetical protein